ncbi:hypothetical protein BpHYR1_018641 [Brachionus plicatilis]|uniref:Uncharacterized protein n=1 Tax=Brachionus plicatilis TaxID=10195 RepID=A0A3M7PUI3_BRAPC|nr:hypothetical protein BpHYR1_018641 [Brachionus plicatilis]
MKVKALNFYCASLKKILINTNLMLFETGKESIDDSKMFFTNVNIGSCQLNKFFDKCKLNNDIPTDINKEIRDSNPQTS